FDNSGRIDVHEGILRLDHGGAMQFDGLDTLSLLENSTLRLTSSLSGTTTNTSQYAPGGTVVFSGGTVASPLLLEVMGADRGAVAEGFDRNFAYGTLQLSAGRVRLTDAADNVPGSGAEALYVDTLIVPFLNTLDLNSLHLYARVAEIAGAIQG